MRASPVGRHRSIWRRIRERHRLASKLRIVRKSPREELQFDPQCSMLVTADVGDEDWLRVWLAPFDLGILREIDRTSCLSDNFAREIAKEQMPWLQRDEDGWPRMQVCRNGGAGRDRDVENKDELVLEERFVVLGRSFERVVVGELLVLCAGSADGSNRAQDQDGEEKFPHASCPSSRWFISAAQWMAAKLRPR